MCGWALRAQRHGLMGVRREYEVQVGRSTPSVPAGVPAALAGVAVVSYAPEGKCSYCDRRRRMDAVRVRRHREKKG